jgi:hypothetical protein
MSNHNDKRPSLADIQRQLDQADGAGAVLSTVDQVAANLDPWLAFEAALDRPAGPSPMVEPTWLEDELELQRAEGRRREARELADWIGPRLPSWPGQRDELAAWFLSNPAATISDLRELVEERAR